MKYHLKIPYIIIFVMSIGIIKLNSQDTNSLKYFPLNSGNIWVYSGSTSMLPQCIRTYYQRIFIDSVVVLNNKTYYKFNYSIRYTGGSGNCGFSYLGNGYYRIDTASGNIYSYTTNSGCSLSPGETFVDSIGSVIRDTSFFCGKPSDKKICRDTAITGFLNLQKQTKYFEGGNFHEYGYWGRYAKDIGLIEYKDGGMSLSSQANLKGCLINGALYGDTTFYPVGLILSNTVVPKTFALFQNYPNPFNPVTQIGFDIPISSFVKLVVYDVSGREIVQLVNEELIQGSFTYEWNASDHPSGIYFYKLQAGDPSTGSGRGFVETKKMVLIK